MASSIFPDKCDICVADKSLCDNCKDNVKYRNLIPKQSYFALYKPVCPFGLIDCVCDPAYIKHYHPLWYEDLYKDITPEEAAKRACAQYASPDDCYDDEDK